MYGTSTTTTTAAAFGVCLTCLLFGDYCMFGWLPDGFQIRAFGDCLCEIFFTGQMPFLCPTSSVSALKVSSEKVWTIFPLQRSVDKCILHCCVCLAFRM